MVRHVSKHLGQRRLCQKAQKQCVVDRGNRVGSLLALENLCEGVPQAYRPLRSVVPIHEFTPMDDRSVPFAGRQWSTPVVRMAGSRSTPLQMRVGERLFDGEYAETLQCREAADSTSDPHGLDD